METGNNIIEEFRKNLQKIEDDTNMLFPCKEWSKHAVEGYFLAIENDGRIGNDVWAKRWGYVGHGELHLWWQPKTFWQALGYEVYLNIDLKKRLTIRARKHNGEETKGDILWSLLKLAKKTAPLVDGIKVNKPARFINPAKTTTAKTINFAVISFENNSDKHLSTKEDGTIDFDATVERLQKAMQLVEEMCKGEKKKANKIAIKPLATG